MQLLLSRHYHWLHFPLSLWTHIDHQTLCRSQISFFKKQYIVLVCIYPNYCHEDDIKKNDEAAAKQFMGVFSKFSIKGNLCNLSLSAIGRGLGLGRCPLTRQIQTSMDKDVISDSGRISTPFCNMESLQCTGYEHFEILILLKVVALAFVGTGFFHACARIFEDKHGLMKKRMSCEENRNQLNNVFVQKYQARNTWMRRDTWDVLCEELKTVCDRILGLKYRDERYMRRQTRSGGQKNVMWSHGTSFGEPRYQDCRDTSSIWMSRLSQYLDHCSKLEQNT